MLATHRTALITGASQGLGYTLAQFLAAQQVDLVITARDENRLNAAATEFSKHGVRVKSIASDVSNAAHRQAVATAVHGLGRLDLLVNNASSLGPLPMPVLKDYPLAGLAEVFQVNTIAPLAFIQDLWPLLRASQGLVVNISSDAALGGYAGWGGYGASKAALDLMTVTLANELRAEHVGVVSVDPGDMRTAMHEAAFPGEDITDRPLSTVTLPFWAWLLGQDPLVVSGQRFQAQAELWEAQA